MTPNTPNTELQQAADEYVGVIDSCFGLYLDCTEGFRQNAESFLKGQKTSLEKLTKTETHIRTIEDLDCSNYFIGNGNPNDPKNILYHRCTQGEFKRRNERDGINERFIGRYCIVLLYEYWESEYRERFAKSVGKNRNEITHDLLGDLRHLRNGIIHNRGKATKECTRLRIIGAIQEGTEICLSPEVFWQVSRALKSFIDDFIRTHTRANPAYRTIWHVQ